MTLARHPRPQIPRRYFQFCRVYRVPGFDRVTALKLKWIIFTTGVQGAWIWQGYSSEASDVQWHRPVYRVPGFDRLTAQVLRLLWTRRGVQGAWIWQAYSLCFSLTAKTRDLVPDTPKKNDIFRPRKGVENVIFFEFTDLFSEQNERFWRFFTRDRFLILKHLHLWKCLLAQE